MILPSENKDECGINTRVFSFLFSHELIEDE